MKRTLLTLLLIATTALGTVTTLYEPEYFDCNGSVTDFVFEFRVEQTTDVDVYLRIVATGVETKLTLNSDYSLSATNNDYSGGGTVTTVSTYSSAYQIIIGRSTELTQEAQFVNNKALENTLDRSVMSMQEVQDNVSRAIRAPIGDESPDMELPNSTVRAGKYAAYDSDGNPTVTNGTTSDIIVSSYMETLIDDATAADARTTLGVGTTDTITIAGLITTDLTTTDIITKGPWVDVRAYGAIGDRTTDDTAAIQAAIDSVPSQPWSTTICFPPGRYLISSTLTIGTGQRIILQGSSVITGSNSTEIYFPTGEDDDFIDASTSLTNVFSVIGLQFTGAGKGTGTGNCLVIGKNGTTSAFDSQIHNCWFTGIPNKCISAVNIRNYDISGCTFEACDYGIYFEVPGDADTRCNSENRIFGNRFFVINKAHIYIKRGRSNMIYGNQFDRLANFSGGTADDTVAAIVIDNSGFANHTTLIANNVFGGTSGGNMNDIILKGTADYAANTGVFGVTIVGNTSFQAVRHFLYVNEADLTAVIDNHIIDACTKTDHHDADLPAIEIIGASHGTYINGNVQRITSGLPDRQVTYGLTLGSSTTGTILGTNFFEGKTADVNILGTLALQHTTGARHIIRTLANDATPSILGSDTWLTGGTTTITDFDDGVTGQIITVIAEHSLIITDGTNIFLDGSGNFSMTATDTLTLICKADNKWYELSRSDNGA